MKVSTVLVGIGVGLFLALRSTPPPEKAAAPPSPKPVAVKPAPVESAPIPHESAPEPAPPVVEKPTDKRVTAVPSSDSLAEEVAILSRAGAELRAGRPAAALKVLDEHQRKFPNGVLAQERSAARIQALCGLGRAQQARAELARLERRFPGSPHVARAKKACGSSLAGE